MPRRAEIQPRTIEPDAVHNSVLVAQLVNRLMLNGKKSIAERTVYDALSGVVSTWVGTNDTPASGTWSPTNNTSPANMVQVTANVYDGGGVGDRNLTQTTGFPGGGADARVNQYGYDWRNRGVATKGGAQASEGTSVNRPFFYVELDNLGQVTAREQYDGDGVSIADTNSDGVPDKPSSGLMRARSTAEYDERGRTFRGRTFSVDQATGSVSTNSWRPTPGTAAAARC